jgi:predicted dehydrogenase
MKTQFTRRSFLQSSLAAVGVLGFPTIIPAAALGASRKITVGCIGLGSFSGGGGGQGGRDMKNFLSLDDDCRVVAVCDAYRHRQEEAKQIVDEKYGDKGCATYGDFRELLARKDIDAVMIATQDHWHALIATAAAAAGKDLYLEKPLGVSVEQGQKIRDAVRRHRRVFQAGTQQRSSGRFRQACELVRNGCIGRVREVRVVAPGPTYQPKYDGPLEARPVPDGFDWAMWRGPAPDKPFNPGRVAHPDWYLQWDYCAGFICNWGVHYLDIAHWGAPELGTESFEVECQGTYRKKGFTDNIEGWNATFTFAGGLKMKFHDLPEKEHDTGTKFTGDEGWIHVSRAGIWAEPASLLQLKPRSGWKRLANWEDPSKDFKMGKAKGVDVPVFTSVNHGQNLLDCMRSRRDPLSNVEATHVATNLGLIAETAARLETKLKWDAKQERFVGNAAANARLHRPLHNGWKL